MIQISNHSIIFCDKIYLYISLKLKIACFPTIKKLVVFMTHLHSAVLIFNNLCCKLVIQIGWYFFKKKILIMGNFH